MERTGKGGTPFTTTLDGFMLAEKVKRTLAIVILACFFLPIAQCSPVKPDGGPVKSEKQSQDLAPLVPAQVVVADLADVVKSASLYDVLLIAVFTWPIAFIAVRRITQAPRMQALVSAIEGLLAAGSLYWLVETIRFLGTVRYGGIMALTAFVIYLLALAATLYRNARPHPEHAV